MTARELSLSLALASARKALGRYGRHDRYCEPTSENPRQTPPDCVCGRAAALAGPKRACLDCGGRGEYDHNIGIGFERIVRDPCPTCHGTGLAMGDDEGTIREAIGRALAEAFVGA